MQNFRAICVKFVKNSIFFKKISIKTKIYNLITKIKNSLFWGAFFYSKFYLEFVDWGDTAVG